MTEKVSNMKVFLGGTCAGWKWRDELQSLLKCKYYNPIVKNWSEEDRLREAHKRETSDYVLYGITNGIKGVYSIAEVVDDSNKRPDKTLFLNLYKSDDRSFTKQMEHSIKAVENLLKSNGVLVFDSIEAVAEFLNNKFIEKLCETKKYTQVLYEDNEGNFRYNTALYGFGDQC